MLRRRPALRFALLFASGIYLASRISLSAAWIFSLVIVLVALCLVFNKSGKEWASSVALQCSVVVLGALLQTLQHCEFQTRELLSANADESVKLCGMVESEPVRQESKSTCVVLADSIVRPAAIDRGSHRIMVILYLTSGEDSSEALQVGKKVEIEGTLRPFPFQRNPGEFDYAKYLELNDVGGIVTVKGIHRVRGTGFAGTRSLRTHLYSVQRALYRTVDNLHPPRHSSFLKGIVFGYREEMPADIKQSFIDTGTIHILAVSGSNVAFVAFVFFSIFGFLRLSRKIVGGLTIIGLVAYMLITGSSPSVVRATIMAIVILCGTLLERKADIYNSISVAALILLFWNTNNLFDIGFQLSFAAVISIVFFYPRLELLVRKIPEKFEEIKRIDAVLKLFAVSLAAQLGTIPFTAYYFGRISIVSLLANIVVVPMSGLCTFIGAAEIGFSFLSQGVAQLYAAANDFLVWFLLGFVKQAADVSFAYLETWHMSPAIAVVYYVVVLGIFNIRRARIPALAIIFFLTLGNGLIFADLWSASHPALRATVIDVGQGDAILLESPNAKRLLIDAGPSFRNSNAGARTIVPFLKRNGITRLEYFLITHPHSDHIGGACSILQSLQVDTLLVTSSESASSRMKRVFEIARTGKVRIKVLNRGEQIPIDSAARLYVLHPSPGEANDETWNNTSIVLKAMYGESSLLLVGDAESSVERKMIKRYGTFLACDIIKAGHHGSSTSTCEEFVNAVRPRMAVISVGAYNKFGHPSPMTLKTLEKHSIELHRTDKSGAIILESDGMHWRRREWR
jgi:competence protein ComEC